MARGIKFGSRKKWDCTIRAVKTMALVYFSGTAKLMYKPLFSHMQIVGFLSMAQTHHRSSSAHADKHGTRNKQCLISTDAEIQTYIRYPSLFLLNILICHLILVDHIYF